MGIRVNAVAPGTIATERYEREMSSLEERERERVAHNMSVVHASERLGTPREVASVIAFLLEPASSNITGAVIPVDGGRGVYAYEPKTRPL